MNRPTRRCRRRVEVLTGLLAPLLAVFAPAPTLGQVRPASPGAPDFDVRALERRGLRSLAQPATTGPQASALEALRGEQADLVVRWSAITGGARHLHAYGRPLTAPLADTADAAALRFVREQAPLLALGVEDVAGLVVARSYRSSHNNAGHVFLQQQVDGIDVFGARLRINLDAQNRLLSVSGELRHRCTE